MFKRKPVTAMVGDRRVLCLICGGEQFWDRAVQLNTSGMELLGIEWGFVHEFAGDAIELYKTGYTHTRLILRPPVAPELALLDHCSTD
jgi:hypothetical protein